MTPMEAWGIISANLNSHYKLRRSMYPNSKGYTDAETEAEIICFRALKEMAERCKNNAEANKS